MRGNRPKLEPVLPEEEPVKDEEPVGLRSDYKNYVTVLRHISSVTLSEVSSKY